MKTVQQLLEAKGREIWTVQPYSSVFDALALMADKEIGALVVTDGNKPVGVLSERDYARKVILKGRASQDTLVADIMSTDVVTASPTTTIDECMALMTECRIRHLPVVDGGALVGIVSIGDLVKAIIAEQQFTIEQLEQYING